MERVSGVKLRRNNLEPPMSALGQKQTFRSYRSMSALPPIADIEDVEDSLRCEYATKE